MSKTTDKIPFTDMFLLDTHVIHYEVYDKMIKNMLSVVSKSHMDSVVENNLSRTNKKKYIEKRMFVANRIVEIISKILTRDMLDDGLINAWEYGEDIESHESEEFISTYNTYLDMISTYTTYFINDIHVLNGISITSYILTISTLLEESINNRCCDKIHDHYISETYYCDTYGDISLEFLTNLDSTNYVRNDSLFAKIFKDKWFNAGGTGALELFPTRNKPIFDMLNEIDIERNSYEHTFSPIHSCKRCGNMTVIFTEQNTRASDEPSTLYFKCMTCENNWHVNG